MAKVNVDPITLEVVRGSLVSTVLQMRATLVKTAYAPILYESKDFSCGLISSGGELAAMSEDFSGHVFAMALGLQEARNKFEDKIEPGDVLAVNDPYTGGTHMNDVAFYTPMFVDGKVLLYICVRAHWADVGGANPGSFSGQDTEIYQEGVRIVPVKLLERGVINRALWDVMFANMRLADEQEGNAMAMLDTARVAEMNIQDVVDKYDADTVASAIDLMMDGSEANMKERIKELPDGDFYYEQYADNSGLSPEPMPFKVKLTINGDHMLFDFTGSSPQVVAPMNCGVPVSQGGVYVILKSWLDPKSPVNGGTFRPVDFIIPEGSCLAAQLPAAVGGCWELFRQLQTCVIGLFAQIIPHNVGAENEGGVQHHYVAGFDATRGRAYILYEYPYGGTPATNDTDGATGTFSYDGGDTPSVRSAEGIEQREPLLIEGLKVNTDGEGAGRQRSGLGVTRLMRILSNTSMLSVLTDRSLVPPWGAEGAPPGAMNACTVFRGGEEIEPSALPGKVKAFPLIEGDVVSIQGCAGGGVGDPLDREIDLVWKDVFDGYISRKKAKDVYGVIIENNHVDNDGTSALRRQLKDSRRYYEVALGSDEFDAIGCRLCTLSKDLANEIGVGNGDIVEYSGKSAAPLRAWVNVTNDAPKDKLTIGPIGQGILQVSAGDKIRLNAVPVKKLVPSNGYWKRV